MARVIRATTTPKFYTPGSFVAATVVVIVFDKTGEVHLMPLLLAMLLKVVVDGLWYGLTQRKLLDERIEVRDEIL